ncbi:branched-chain amino acid transaminase [Aquibium sp. A9E412]|uniref:branched-chain amino acid transaminase n=1 Tax=Aquibium sp. A9E412 TaxID=2976767 RepID=UPI0025B00CEE|nr:branched-chain amino acid transaminase [Aquibium sp. A9E412]MDN2564641.1 branched-chain amino acid transaminase [Aquibium sp. A9E412]
MDKAEKIWIDGKIVPWDDATVHLVSNTLHYGFGVFEGIRCYKAEGGAAVFRLREHMVRLARSAEVLGFSLPHSLDTLVEGTRAIIKANGFEQCYIRPLAYVGEGGMGLAYEECSVSVAIAVWYWGEYVGKGTVENGSRARVSTYARHHINTNMSKAKACGNYMLFQMARTEARRDGYDEALLLDSNGHVAEGSVEHIFLVRDGVLVTPPLTHLLEGITRDTVIVLARELGLEVREELFSRDHVLTSDEAFFAGTGAEVTPLVELDRRPIGSGKRGPVTKRIQDAYFDAVYGRSTGHPEWLTFV